ncbi:hypothetical protein NDU88_010275 [Pleurodeles waltl]|uniref:Uncharacterized protein n=1 Tax=Pleurodeles waltl TaxID=8319 RepID=A0AAV7QZS8_PLEWA|nr:hypothetical protein NDU88_010275 [Pleurodeles waltl]
MNRGRLDELPNRALGRAAPSSTAPDHAAAFCHSDRDQKRIRGSCTGLQSCSGSDGLEALGTGEAPAERSGLAKPRDSEAAPHKYNSPGRTD